MSKLLIISIAQTIFPSQEVSLIHNCFILKDMDQSILLVIASHSKVDIALYRLHLRHERGLLWQFFTCHGGQVTINTNRKTSYESIYSQLANMLIYVRYSAVPPHDRSLQTPVASKPAGFPSAPALASTRSRVQTMTACRATLFL